MLKTMVAILFSVRVLQVIPSLQGLLYSYCLSSICTSEFEKVMRIATLIFADIFKEETRRAMRKAMMVFTSWRLLYILFLREDVALRICGHNSSLSETDGGEWCLEGVIIKEETQNLSV